MPDVSIDQAIAGVKDKPLNCVDCRFWDHKRVGEGFCRRSAPHPGKIENEITRWPQTHPKDWCGEGEIVVVGIETVVCGTCRFWFRPPPGIEPLQHGGRFSEWWRNAGLCRRRAPVADAELGGRAFWRATHENEHCGDGVKKPIST